MSGARDPIAACRAVIAAKSKSFALASRLLPREAEAGAVVVYAYCRQVDDAIDLAPVGERAAALARLTAQLDAIYGGAPLGDVVLDGFAAIARRTRIPRRYPAELIAGMAMDVERVPYRTLDELLLYAYRVAGTVGLMMSHVLGVTDDAALENAAHLGMGMQLTNICRDVAEDWADGRLYLPDALLARHGVGALRAEVGRGEPLPATARAGLAGAVGELLAIADRYYASGDRGLVALGWREALAVRTARLVYAEIGAVLRARACDVLGGRAVVPGGRKLRLVGEAAIGAAGEAAARTRRWIGARGAVGVPAREVGFPGDVAVL